MIDQTLPSARRSALLLFVLTAAATRLVPHPPNFTAVPAMALCSGAWFGRRWLAFAAPLLAMLVSDVALCAFVYGWQALAVVAPMYVAVAVTVAIGFRAARSLRSMLLGTVGATLAFFVITNACVWLFGDLYPPTAAGLLACYLAAVPFARNMLLSTLLYGVSLYWLGRWAERRWPRPVRA